MEFKDFRDYLDNLVRQGMLLRVTKEVSPRFEMAAGVYKTGKTDGPALLFENVKDYPGWRVVGGLFVTQRLLAFALQTEESKLLERYLEFGQQRIEPVLVSSGPVKEAILLTRLVLFPEDIRGINVNGHVVVSIYKRNEATPKNIIYAVLATLGLKCVVVVDEDVNIYEPVEVEWAMATRVEPERDVIIIPPANSLPTLGQWGIDATAPLTGKPFGERWLYKKALPPGVSEVDYV